MKNKKWALITGAGSGIGYELAKFFAHDHFSLILVSRNADKLTEAAIALQQMGAPDVIVIPKDLSVPGAAAEIYDNTHKRGIRISALVNNAGAGEYGLFSETDLDRELDILQLNIGAVVHLTKLYLKEMLHEKRGRILNVASVASYLPVPKLAVYAASKAFVLSFSDALGVELYDTGVTVTALIPGATDTEFFRKAGMEYTKAAQFPEDPALVAEIGYTALMDGDAHAFGPGVRPEVLMSSLLPNRNMAKIAKKQMKEDSHGKF